MLPGQHAIYGLGFALLMKLLIVPGLNLIAIALIFLAAVFIDVDHYIVYVYRHKDLNLKRAVNYFKEMGEKLKNKKNRAPLLVLHTVEFMLVLIALSFYHIYFAFIAAGVIFHVLLDYYHMRKHNMLHAVSRSIIHHHLTKHKYNLV